MMARLWILAALAIVTAGLWPGAASARQAEVNVYAGGFWPTETLGGEDFKDEGLWGVRAGGYLTDYLLLDGNLGYANEFSYSGTDVGTSAWLWDANLTLQFLPWDIRLSPFLTAGAGGLTAGVDNGDVFFLFADDGGFLEVGDPEPGLQFIHLEDGDTFFGVNYGGGLKATRLWGPVGFRFDLRGARCPTSSETTSPGWKQQGPSCSLSETTRSDQEESGAARRCRSRYRRARRITASNSPESASMRGFRNRSTS